MSWNYRVVKTTGKTKIGKRTRRWTRYAVHEVYYHNDVPVAYTREPCWPQGVTKAEFARDMSQFIRDVGAQSWLTEDDFKTPASKRAAKAWFGSEYDPSDRVVGRPKRTDECPACRGSGNCKDEIPCRACGGSGCS